MPGRSDLVLVSLLTALASCGDREVHALRTGVDRPGDAVTASPVEDGGEVADTGGDGASPPDTGDAEGTDTATIGDTVTGNDTTGADTRAADTSDGGETCVIGSTSGTCRHISACADDEGPIEGYCAGGPQVRCCLPGALAGCSAATAPGACVEVATCTGDFAATAGLCPGPSAVRCCSAVDGATSCDPAVLPTPNAGLVEEPGAPGCPDGMVGVTPTLCVDRFEASLVRADAPTVSLSPYHAPGTTAIRAVSVRWAIPQGNITGVQAAAACSAAGKRLCASSEWLRACRGPEGWTYPYGATREPGRCNDARPVHPAIERFGTSAAWIWSQLDDPCIAQLPAGVALTGEHDGCVSAEGAYDLMGNLHEWVDDADGAFRGGFYVDTVINGEGCLYVTTAHNVQHHDYSTGFRCCADRTAQ